MSKRSLTASGVKWTRWQLATAGFVVLDRTPFYVESGGQISDVGLLTAAARLPHLTPCRRRAGHGAPPQAGSASTRSPLGRRSRKAIASAPSSTRPRRDATRRNHTATHLLHAALRQVLGTHVRQAGSLVAPERLRFDFSHFGPMSEDEKRQIERIVNEQIYRNTTVNTEVRSAEEAITSGAMALFGEKYGDRVRVVTIPGFSMELCGGTHVRATGDIGPFVITEESGVAAGVRRIEALTGAGAVAHIQRKHSALDHTLQTLGVSEDRVADTIARLQTEARRLARENDQLKMKLALGGSRPEEDDAVAVADARLVARRVLVSRRRHCEGSPIRCATG